MRNTRVSGVLIVEGKILLALHKRLGEEYFVLLGGGLEKGETPEECIVREFKEESDLVVEVKHKLFERKSDKSYEWEVYFSVKLISGELDFSKNPDLAGNVFQSVKWVELKNLEKLRFYPKSVKEFLLNKFSSVM